MQFTYYEIDEDICPRLRLKSIILEPLGQEEVRELILHYKGNAWSLGTRGVYSAIDNMHNHLHHAAILAAVDRDDAVYTSQTMSMPSLPVKDNFCQLQNISIDDHDDVH